METPATHWIDWDEAGNGRRVRALCGVWICRADGSPRPTCPDCRALLERRDAMRFE
jgi:hypothetical protein